LDPHSRHEIKEMIYGLADNNQTVLFSSHDMEEVEKLADRLIFMNHGKIVDQGQLGALIKKHQVENLEMLCSLKV